jgi:hypothetical protein
MVSHFNIRINVVWLTLNAGFLEPSKNLSSYRVISRTSIFLLDVSIRTYSERSQKSTQELKKDPSEPEGTARTSQATDQRPTVRSQTPALS